MVNSRGKDMDNDLQALAMLAEHMAAKIEVNVEKDYIEIYPEVPDSLDYTGIVLESMNFSTREGPPPLPAAAKCTARSPEAEMLPAQVEAIRQA